MNLIPIMGEKPLRLSLSGDTICPPKFPIKKLGFFYLSGVKEIGQAATILDQFVENNRGEKVEPYKISEVLWWDGFYCFIGAFDPRTGQQIGMIQAAYNKKQTKKEDTPGSFVYDTAVIVASSYRGLGFAKIMRLHLEHFMASVVEGKEILILDEIQANGREEKAAARAFLASIGTLQVHDHRDLYYKYIKCNSTNPVVTLSLSRLTLTRRGEKLALPQSLRRRREKVKKGRRPVAHGLDSITFYQNPQLVDLQFDLWVAAKQAGYSVGVNL